MRSRILQGLVVALLCAPLNARAAVLLVDNGILTGATSVLVNAQEYRVTFADGKCTDLFGGCNEVADFTFQDAAAAAAAATALLDQVLLNVPAGQFDGNPALTAGCVSSLRCFVSTPYGFASGEVVSKFARNLYSSLTDGIADSPTFLAATDFSSLDQFTWAVWAPAAAAPQPPAAAPEPGSMALTAVGLFALVFLRRRPRRRSAAL